VKYPLVVMCTPDGELPAMLRGFARDHRWVLDEVRRSDAVAARLAAPGPAVAFWQLDPTADPPPPLELVAAWRRDLPEAAVVVLDLGARYVLFPPFTRLVLEDLAGGLMAAAVERLTGRPPDPTPPDPEAIDLAETGHADD
jgi:hypothetical protein